MTRVLPLSVAALLAVLPGCGEGAPRAKQLETSNLRSIVSLYNYAFSSTGRPPANEQEFKQFIATNGTAMMETLHIANPDEFFISERDGQPFVVVYGQRPQDMSRDVVAYEQTGVDGRRQVGLSLGSIEEADEARFRELVPTPPVP